MLDMVRSLVSSSTRGKLWVLPFIASTALTTLAYSSYLTFSRELVKEVLGGDYSFLALLVASETVPTLISLGTGALADVIGRRSLILIGTSMIIPYTLMSYVELKYLPILSTLGTIIWTLATPAVMGTYLDATRSSGKLYSIYAIGNTIGWALGGVIAGSLSYILGKKLFIILGVISTTGYILPYIFYPKSEVSTRAPGRLVISGIRSILTLFIGISATYSGLELFSYAFSFKILDITKSSLLYGLYYTTLPAILGAFVRPLAGYLTDRYDPGKLLLVTIVSEAVLYTLLALTTGYLALVLWLIPIWPFLDQSAVMTVSRSLERRLQGLAAGIINTSWSLAGIAILASIPLLRTAKLLTVLEITLTLLTIALTLILTWKMKMRKAS